MPSNYEYGYNADSPNPFQPQQGQSQEQRSQGQSQAQQSPQLHQQPQPQQSPQPQPHQQAPQGAPQQPPRTQAQYAQQQAYVQQPQPQQQYAQQQAYAQTAGQGAYQQAQPLYVAAPPQKKSHGWIVAIVIIVCLFAFTAFCVKACSDAVGSLGTTGLSSGPEPNSVAIIEIEGTIQYDGSECSPEGLKTLLDEAEGDDNIKALVLRVNSGGGVATAGEEMAEYLRDFSKPVVVSSASINASAAYEISAQADYIYVARSTEIGAIGTAMELTDISGLLDMLGVNMEVITSAESKDSSYGYRPLTDEEREYYQHMVTQINEMFIENVAKGRGMTTDEVRALATGLAFTGEDAVANGLADEVGTLEDATDKAAQLAGVSDYETYDLGFYDYDLSSLSYLLGSTGDAGNKLAQPMLKN